MVKDWVVCPCMSKTLGSQTSGFTPLEVLCYGDVNLTGVDYVKDTWTVVLPPGFQAFPV